MAIAIRSPNWIGDAIMSLPAVAAVHRAYPDIPLTIVAKRYLADLYHHLPGVNRVLAIPDGSGLRETLTAIRQLRSQRQERGLLLTNSFHSALLFRLGGISRATGYARDGRSWLLSQVLPWGDDPIHHRDYYLRLAEAFSGRPAEPTLPRLVIAGPEQAAAERRLEEWGAANESFLIGVSPTAAYGPAKAWPAARFRELIGRLVELLPKARVLLFGTERERSAIDTVLPPERSRVLNLSGRSGLRESLALIARCRLFVANDSGLMHAAAALQVPLVAIFGPTRPERTAPLAEAGRLRLLHRPPACAPCLHRRCPTDQRCMTGISVDRVLGACRELLPPEP